MREYINLFMLFLTVVSIHLAVTLAHEPEVGDFVSLIPLDQFVFAVVQRIQLNTFSYI